MPHLVLRLSTSLVLVIAGALSSWARSPAQERGVHWAFEAPARPAVPSVRESAWTRNPIDAFVLRRLENAGLRPSPPAERHVLIRRLALDLTGLLPEPEEVAQFVADDSLAAYQELVDRYLASPHFGERWARHWLDVARYADSNGYSIDGPRSIWPYRDWVIDVINDDLPFDDFVVQQMAGDLLEGATPEHRIATGFHRNTMINQEGGVDKEEFRIEAVKDRVDTTSTAFLGLTIACARCHDHKHDPLTMRDYYRLFAFFNDDHERDYTVVEPEHRERYRELRGQLDGLEKEAAAYAKGLAARRGAWETGLDAAALARLPDKLRAALAVPAGERDKAQSDAIARHFRDVDPGYRERQERIAAVRAQLPKTAKTMILAQRGEPRVSHVHVRGDFGAKGDVVEPGTPAVLTPPLRATGRPTRLDLARWLVDPANPLTARVTVNRIWQRLFGRGLVATENDFGTQGAPPSHPRLLDWLATELAQQGWSRKALIRTIVTSATYRQASNARADLVRTDPQNALLARQNRLRLEAEIVRDAALCASGLLSRSIGGPSVFPPQPAGVMTLGQSRRAWKPSSDAARYRRGLYTFFWRATPHPALSVFDAPSAMEACTRRTRSNTPLQALTLLNEAQFFECAQALAQRILRELPECTDRERIVHAGRVCLSRDLGAEEIAVLADLLGRGSAASLPQWIAVARVLLNLDEFITRE